MSRRRNFDRAHNRDRMRRQGSEPASSAAPMMAPLLAAHRAARPPALSKAELRAQAAAAMAATAATAPSKPVAAGLAEPAIVDRFWRNRSGECVTVQLRDYKGRAVLDMLVEATGGDGRMRPTGKGLSLLLVRLPDLQKALRKAERRAIELGLTAGGKGDRDGQRD